MSYEAYGPGLYFAAAAAAVFGAIMGSFLNCAADRTARGESFLTGRSRCDSCGHVLGPLELIPVVSWVLQRGKCRACGAPISIRCPVTELLCSLLTALFLLRFGFTALGLRNYVFLCCLFCLSLVDLEAFIIPDGCLLTALAAYLAALPLLRPGWSAVGRGVLAGLCTKICFRPNDPTTAQCLPSDFGTVLADYMTLSPGGCTCVRREGHAVEDPDILNMQRGECFVKDRNGSMYRFRIAWRR